MRRTAAIWMVALVAGGLAQGQDAFFEAIDKARQLHEAGQYDEAIEAYRQAQIERPEADVIPYGLGSVLYEKAMALAQEGRREEAVAALERAREHFTKVKDEAEDPAVRREAAYAAASAAGHMADLRNPQEEYDQKVNNLEAAINELENFVARNPRREDAQHNLDAARLRRKQLLMQPPPPQQQQPQQSEDEEEEGDQEQEQEQGEQQQGDDEQSQEDQQPGDQEQGEQEDGQQGPEESEEDQQSGQQDQQEEDGEEQQQQQDQPEPGENEQQEQQGDEGGQTQDEQEQQQMPAGSPTDEKLDPDDMKNIQAILQSLEEMDEREQRSRKQGQARDMRGAWW